MKRESSDRHTKGERSVPGQEAGGASNRRAGDGGRRRLLAGLLALVVSLLLTVGAIAAPAGYARSGKVGSRAARAADRGEEEVPEEVTKEQEKAVVTVNCSSVTIQYRDFPDAPGNSVRELVTVVHIPLAERQFTFDGSEGTSVLAIETQPGINKLDVELRWNGNGIRGNYDIPAKIKCPRKGPEPEPAFTIEKRQRIVAPETQFGTGVLTGEVGQTVEYKFIVENTGEVPLTFASFSDPRCDPGTITGPSSEVLEPGRSTVFFCTHLLTTADAESGGFTNIAMITGTPTEGQHGPITNPSGEVQVVVAKQKEKEKEKEPEPTPGTTPGGSSSTSGSTAQNGVQAAKSGLLGPSLAKSGVQAFAGARIPALSVPAGCVRSGFRASVKSTGVKSVSFYLDGHKLKSLTAKSARRGKISVSINGAKLKVGAHKVRAAITMNATSSGKHVHGSRTRTVVRCHSAVVTPRFTG
jgi:uncharacterized repeat protein (TIGR01451 family)